MIIVCAHESVPQPIGIGGTSMAKRTTKPRLKRIKHAEIVTGFGERLRALRLASGLSQAELASKAQVHWTYIGRLEHGQAAPGLDLIERLAKAFNTSVMDLIPTGGADPIPFLHERARTRFESILQRGDRSTLGVLNAILTMMDDSMSRRS